MSTEDGLLPEERTFAGQVKALREERGWSQNDLAGRLRETGLAYVNQSTVSRIEKGSRPARMIEAQRLSEVFGRSVHLMTHPDSRETLIALTAPALRSFRRDYVAFKEKLRATAAAQVAASDYMAELQDLFGYDPELDPGTRERLDDLLLNLRQFCSIDLQAEAERAIAEGKTSADGEHQTEA